MHLFNRVVGSLDGHAYAYAYQHGHGHGDDVSRSDDRRNRSDNKTRIDLDEVVQCFQYATRPAF